MVVYLYAAILTVLLLALTYNVILRRKYAGIWLGHGGHDALERAIRAQGNFVEYVPYALLLLYMAEDAGAAELVIHVLGATLIAARLLHAWGLTVSRGHSFGRLSGTVLTQMVLIGTGAFCIYFYLVAPDASAVDITPPDDAGAGAE
jgi:uncharacterized membrane protein YecN with MAPEG domain